MIKTVHDIKRRTMLTASALLLASSAVAIAQTPPVAPAKISTSVDTTRLTMGERTNLHIEVLKNSHSGHIVDFEGFKSEGLRSLWEFDGQEGVHPTIAGIEVRKIEIDSADLGNGRVQINYSLLLQPFNPGDITIPAARYVIDGDTLRSNVTTLSVLEPEMPQEMRDSLIINPMRGTLAIESRWYDWIPQYWYWWVLGLALAALIAAVIVLYRKNGKTLLPVKRRVPPYIVAKRRLSDLKKKRLDEKGHTKAYYTELTEILRQYLGGRFRIYALEMTSSQILDAMKGNSETAPFVDTLKPMFTVADFVKFAKQEATRDENIRSYNAVEKFVDDTRPVEDTNDAHKKGKAKSIETVPTDKATNNNPEAH